MRSLLSVELLYARTQVVRTYVSTSASPFILVILLAGCFWFVVKCFNSINSRCNDRCFFFIYTSKQGHDPISRVSSRVVSGRVGSARLGSARGGSGWLGSARVGSSGVGAGRVGLEVFKNLTRRVGARIGDPTHSDPILDV